MPVKTGVIQYCYSAAIFFPSVRPMFCGPGTSVGIAMEVSRIESSWGARFSARVQTSPGAHPASCTMGTGSFPGVKSGRTATLNPHPLLVPWS